MYIQMHVSLYMYIAYELKKQFKMQLFINTDILGVMTCVWRDLH